MDVSVENQKANECDYKKHDSHLKDKFINSINDVMMTAEIIRELTTLRKTNDVTKEQVLTYMKRIEVQGA